MTKRKVLLTLGRRGARVTLRECLVRGVLCYRVIYRDTGCVSPGHGAKPRPRPHFTRRASSCHARNPPETRRETRNKPETVVDGVSRVLAVVGSREWGAPARPLAIYRTIGAILDQYLQPGDFVLSGGARGPDVMAIAHAKKRGHETDVIPYEKSRGKAGGPIRNTKIVRRADAVLAFWDGKSRGTLDVIRKATAKGIPITIVHQDGRFEHHENDYQVLQFGDAP